MRTSPSPEALSRFRQVALDDRLRSLRSEFRETTVNALESVGSWLAIDAFLAGGDLPLDGGPTALEASRFHAFHAVAAVAQMAAELASAASLLVRDGRLYAVASLTRQLLECEYHLAHFSSDFGAAALWALASPSDMRNQFAPGRLRKIEGFRNEEYWSHCDSGGHPSPAGRHLLRNDVRSIADRGFVEATIALDLTQHVHRAWNSLDAVLVAEHARYVLVRADERASVRDMHERWVDADPIAMGPNLSLLEPFSGDPEPDAT